MRILVLTNLAPHPAHTARAANVVVFQLITALAKQEGIESCCLRVEREVAPNLTNDEVEGERLMREAGAALFPPVTLPPAAPRRPALLRGLWPTEIDYVPEASHRPLLQEAVATAEADIILVPWTEWLTALCAGLPGKKFAYYGNPPPKNTRAWRNFSRTHGGDRWALLRQTIYNRRLEAFHLKQMRRYDWLGNVAANDAGYYRRHGHPNAFYIQNMWIDRFGESWRMRRTGGGGRPIRIVSNVGYLAGTANTHGLEILGCNLLPELRRAMGGHEYIVEIMGTGDAHPAIRPFLDVPEVRLRGFVDDIDAEMLDAELFLCMNNASAYNVGHTRYLHAWSLGCCVVAHRNAALTMPEIVHGKNALLGGSPAEIADLIASAAADPVLRRRLGEGGYQTFRENFTAEHVATRIAAECRKLGGVP